MFDQLKKGVRVTDTWFPAQGVGRVETVLKTRVKILFGNKLITYDRPHCRFLSPLPSSKDPPMAAQPYTTTSASHVLAELPPDPVIPKEGSWMLMSTTAVLLDKKRAQLYWTWKRTTNTNLRG